MPHSRLKTPLVYSTMSQLGDTRPSVLTMLKAKPPAPAGGLSVLRILVVA